jgi:hypothetical protein
MIIGCNMTNFGLAIFLLLLHSIVGDTTPVRGVGNYSPLDGWVATHKT